MKKEHWQDIYATKGMQEVSWFQKVPEISLDLIQKVAPNTDASIIDVPKDALTAEEVYVFLICAAAL